MAGNKAIDVDDACQSACLPQSALARYLGVLGGVVDRRGEQEGVVAAGNGVVVAALFAQVGAENLQAAELLQVLQVGVALLVLCGDDTINSESSRRKIRSMQMEQAN